METAFAFPSSYIRTPYGSLSCLNEAGGHGVSTFRVNTTMNDLDSALPPVMQLLRGETLSPSYLITHLFVYPFNHPLIFPPVGL